MRADNPSPRQRTRSDKPNRYRAPEAAAEIGCTEWWLKEQARKRRIPFCWIGGAYMWTDAHIQQILTIFEYTPPAPPSAAQARARPAVSARPRTVTDPAIPLLAARPPRRRPAAGSNAQSAA